jgi:hypothetical protein
VSPKRHEIICGFGRCKYLEVGFTYESSCFESHTLSFMDRQQCFIGEIATFEGFGSLIFGT